LPNLFSMCTYIIYILIIKGNWVWYVWKITMWGPKFITWICNRFISFVPLILTPASSMSCAAIRLSKDGMQSGYCRTVPLAAKCTSGYWWAVLALLSPGELNSFSLLSPTTNFYRTHRRKLIALETSSALLNLVDMSQSIQKLPQRELAD